jgi:hypothetical protein
LKAAVYRWLILSILVPGALRAHPLGEGVVVVDGDFQIVSPMQTGTYISNGTSIYAKDNITNAGSGDASLAWPLGKAWAVEGFVSVATSTLMFSRDADAPGSLTGREIENGDDLGLETKVWTSEYFREPFMTSESGNPDGRLGWPILWAGSDWQDDLITSSLTSQTGGFSAATAAPDLREHFFNGHYGIILPLTPNLSLWASYGRAYSAEASNAFGNSSDGGDTEFESAGASGFFTWDPDSDLHNPHYYVSTVGFVGQFRVDLDLGRQYDIPSARTTSKGASFSVKFPVVAALAIGAGYSYTIEDKGLLYGIPGFVAATSSQGVQDFTLSATVNLQAIIHQH